MTIRNIAEEDVCSAARYFRCPAETNFGRIAAIANIADVTAQYVEHAWLDIRGLPLAPGTIYRAPTRTARSSPAKGFHATLPTDMNFRMPAEWEPHEATWLGWPHELTDWPGKFAPIPWAFAEIVRHLARVERVNLLVENRAAESRVKAILTKVRRRAGGGYVFSCADRSRMDARFGTDWCVEGNRAAERC